jgi:hypothetical protein
MQFSVAYSELLFLDFLRFLFRSPFHPALPATLNPLAIGALQEIIAMCERAVSATKDRMDKAKAELDEFNKVRDRRKARQLALSGLRSAAENLFRHR